MSWNDRRKSTRSRSSEHEQRREIHRHCVDSRGGREERNVGKGMAKERNRRPEARKFPHFDCKISSSSIQENIVLPHLLSSKKANGIPWYCN